MFCPDGSTNSVGISPVIGREYQEPAMPLSRALVETPTEWPAVSLWYDQIRRTVRCEDRIEMVRGDGSARDFRLDLDLDALADPDAPVGDAVP